MDFTSHNFSTHNLMQTLGIEFDIIEDNYIEATMPVNAQTCQPWGYLHGGATLALAESVAGIGSSRLCKSTELALGIQVSANHIHSATVGHKVVAKGKLLHKGKTTHIWNVDVFLYNTSYLISSVRITNAIIIQHDHATSN